MKARPGRMVEAPLVGAVGAPVVVLLPAGGGTPVPVPTGTTVVWTAVVVWTIVVEAGAELGGALATED